MKHVFYIHSHITWLISYSVIQHYKMNKREVLLLFDERYKFSLNHEIIQFNSEIVDPKRVRTSHTVAPFIKKLLGNKLSILLREFLNKVYVLSKIGKRPYIAYLPHDMKPIYKQIIFLSNCKGYNYIEDGLAIYFNTNFGNYSMLKPTNFLSKKLIPKAVLYNFNSCHFSSFPKLQGAFSFSDLGFQQINNHLVLPLPSELEYRKKVKVKNVIILGGELKAGIISSQSVFQFYYDMFSSLTETNFALKFHQTQHDEERNTVKNILSELNIDFEILPEDTVMEFEILDGNLKLYGVVSSLLFYNVLFANGKSYSLYERVKHHLALEYKKHVEVYMEFLQKHTIEVIK